MMILANGINEVSFFSSEEVEPSISFSIIIPFRNEAENLPNLLKSIENLKYPPELFEVILVNDSSEDISEAIVMEVIEKSKFSMHLLQNKHMSNSPKKDAISEAIKNAKFGWIATTDADCEIPENWLKKFDAFIQKNNPKMVCGPVRYESNGSLLENFQQLDGMSLQAVTIGSFGLNNPVLCNGANLAYNKNAFLKVNGFTGNDHIASGDDIFLMEKMKKAFPKQVQYLKLNAAIVSTKPQQTWKNVINQRIRWTSKTSKQKNLTSLGLGILVLLVNISILMITLLLIFDPQNWVFYLFLFYFKLITDFILIHKTAIVFNKNISFWNFHLQIFIYATIVLITIIGSLRGNYSWKGRNFQKQ